MNYRNRLKSTKICQGTYQGRRYPRPRHSGSCSIKIQASNLSYNFSILHYIIIGIRRHDRWNNSCRKIVDNAAHQIIYLHSTSNWSLIYSFRIYIMAPSNAPISPNAKLRIYGSLKSSITALHMHHPTTAIGTAHAAFIASVCLSNVPCATK